MKILLDLKKNLSYASFFSYVDIKIQDYASMPWVGLLFKNLPNINSECIVNSFYIITIKIKGTSLIKIYVQWKCLNHATIVLATAHDDIIFIEKMRKEWQ